MKISLDAKRTWKPVKTDDGEFEVEVSPPSFADKMRHQELLISDADYIEHRLRSTIIGWRGLETDEGPLDFSWENLAAVCAQHHDVFQQLLVLAGNAYMGLTEETAKNSEPPANDSSVGAA